MQNGHASKFTNERGCKITDKDINKKYYDNIWKRRQLFVMHGPGNRWARFLIKDMLRSIDMASVKSILDIGCGSGVKTHFMAKCFQHADVKGIDFSTGGIAMAKEYLVLPNLSYEVYDAEMIVKEDIRVDLVTCFDVLGHIENWEFFLSKLANISGKYILLSYPIGRVNDFRKGEKHVLHLKKGMVEEYIQSSLGLRCIKTYYAGFPFFELARFATKGSDVSENIMRSNYGYIGKIYSNIMYFILRFLSSKKKFGTLYMGLYGKS